MHNNYASRVLNQNNYIYKSLSIHNIRHDKLYRATAEADAAPITKTDRVAKFHCIIRKACNVMQGLEVS